MAQVTLSPRALSDLERLFEFVADRNPTAALASVRRIRKALGMLAEHPLMGRRRSGQIRELVISRGRSGYVALYRWHEARERVVVLAIRHQREAGYSGE